jgi:GT2 family glycosyltransferase
MGTASISVIVPTRDTRELTLRCLAALWMCKPQPDEVIVVDDGGEDDTVRSVVRKYPRHMVVRLPQPEGLVDAANRGLARACGDVLLVLDAGIEVNREAIGAIRQAFAENPRLGIGGASLRDAQGTKKASGGRLPTSMSCFALASGLPLGAGRLAAVRATRSQGSQPVEWVSGSAMAIRREVWRRFGPFDTAFVNLCREMDLCLAAAASDWQIALLPAFQAIQHRASALDCLGGAAGHCEPQVLWSDLLRFARKRFGRRRERQTARALKAGGRMRLWGLRLAAPLVSRERRDSWREQSAAYAQALRALDVVGHRSIQSH